MSRFFWFSVVGALFLVLGVSPLVAQEVVFSAGPAVTPAAGGSNGGFAWADINGDGLQDVFIPPNNVLINHLTYFTQVASSKTAALSNNVNSVGGLFADINGDGVPDLWSTNNAAPQTGLFYDSVGVYVVPTGTGDLSKAGMTGSVFAGMAVADIDHSNYLSAAWHGLKQASWSDAFIYKPGEGIELLRGGPTGFTRIGNGAAPGNLAIDTSRAFETWDVHFLDANNDTYQDLLMPSFRHGFRPFNGGSDTIGAKKGTILYLNDGTGKFYVPNAANLGRTLYALDSMSAAGVFYARAVGDTGIIVDDTVRHFNAIGSQWGDVNNDGNVDLLLTGTESNNYDGLRRATNIVLLYGKGDGTFTFKWNGSNIVDAGLPTSGGIRAWDIGDYNNDGMPDVYASTTYGATRLFRGNGNGTFAEVTTQNYVATAGGGRAGGFVDY
ncbi:MAG TPA: VCBS repeat-containing protein, partial [Bacteroidota bacterium]|nr:VCBS repeat-containing protein [Bacteroidota bacterium]